MADDRTPMDFTSLLRHVATEYTIYENRQFGERDEMVQIYKRLKLHPRIRKVSKDLFREGRYRNAILDAFIEVEKMTKEKSGVDEIGQRLYGNVFNAQNPILKLNALQTETDRDEQEGFMYLFKGASTGVRDPKAHDTFTQKDPFRTLEYLCLASLLAKRIDESRKVT